MFTILFWTVLVTFWVVGAVASGIAGSFFFTEADVTHSAVRLVSSKEEREEKTQQFFKLAMISTLCWASCVAIIASFICTAVYSLCH